jgi:hypothetical protein
LRTAVCRVEGVEDIDEQLEVDQVPGDMPSLHGDGHV